MGKCYNKYKYRYRVGLYSSPFSIPSGTRVAVEVAANQVNGFIYNDTTNNQVRGYINSQMDDSFTVVTTATGVGLTNGAPLLSIWAKRKR